MIRSMIRSLMRTCALLVLIVAAALPAFSQSNPDLQTFFRQNIGLSQDQIAAIRSGQAGREDRAVPHAGRGLLVWRDLHPRRS